MAPFYALKTYVLRFGIWIFCLFFISAFSYVINWSLFLSLIGLSLFGYWKKKKEKKEIRNNVLEIQSSYIFLTDDFFTDVRFWISANWVHNRKAYFTIYISRIGGGFYFFIYFI